jgi:uncharacterized surface protein with fasciclin (FAS1) repeats
LLIIFFVAAGPFTLFAPTDEAFAKIPSGTLNDILGDQDVLMTILSRHLVKRALFAKGIAWNTHETVGGQMIATQVFKKGVIKVAASLDSSAFVQEADLVAANGVVHVIDSVI